MLGLILAGRIKEALALGGVLPVSTDEARAFEQMASETRALADLFESASKWFYWLTMKPDEGES